MQKLKLLAIAFPVTLIYTTAQAAAPGGGAYAPTQAGPGNGDVRAPNRDVRAPNQAGSANGAARGPTQARPAYGSQSAPTQPAPANRGAHAPAQPGSANGGARGATQAGPANASPYGATQAAPANRGARAPARAGSTNRSTPAPMQAGPTNGNMRARNPEGSRNGASMHTSADQPQTSAAGVSYVVGGIGSESRRKLKQEYGDYPLHLVTARGKAYVTGAQVTVKNSQGKTVLETQMNGPLLYADLPSGSYTVTATIKSQDKTQHLSIKKGKSQTVDFSFPSEGS